MIIDLLENGGEISIGDGFVSNKSIIADNTNTRIDNEIINISKILSLKLLFDLVLTFIPLFPSSYTSMTMDV